MHPRADQRLRLITEPFDRQQRRVAIAVSPAGNDDGGDIEACKIFANRPMPPEIIAALVLQPLLHEEGFLLQALQPHIAPIVADDGRIG